MERILCGRIEAAFLPLPLLGKRANVGDQALHIRIADFAGVSWHFALALVDDVCELRVRLGFLQEMDFGPGKCIETGSASPFGFGRP